MNNGNDEQSLTLKHHLQEHLEALVGERDPFFSPLGHLVARSYIQAQLSQWGAVELEEFEYSGQTYCNLCLDLPRASASLLQQNLLGESDQALGQELGREAGGQPAILIGAHYDAVHGSPGADDNATGVAALLELARVFAALPARLPLRLVAFDGEEYGRLGSLVHAQLAREAQLPLQLMLSLEMLGYCDPRPGSQRYPFPLQYLYPSTGDFIALVGNLRSLPQLLRGRRCFQHRQMPCCILPIWNQGHPVPRTRDSDHAAFWDAGYNAILVTDTADLRNPHYHQSGDRLETLDLNFLTRVTLGLVNWIYQL